MSKIKTPSGKIISPAAGSWKDIWKLNPESGWFEFFWDDKDEKPEQCAFFFGEDDVCVYQEAGGTWFLWESQFSRTQLPKISSREDVERWAKLRSFE